MTEQLYSKTKIYKLVCNDIAITDCYVGHTTNWIKRKSKHKACVNLKDKTHSYHTKYDFIRNNGGWDNWSMILIEEYPCNNKLQAEQRERYWIEELKAKLNYQTPSITIDEQKEKRKIYYEKNKEQIKLKHKEWIDNNKDKIADWTHKYYIEHKDEIIQQHKINYENKKNTSSIY
jgi:hypothetical protein